MDGIAPAPRAFEYSHLPEKLQPVSSRFGELAKFVAEKLPPNEERAWVLRYLLLAKDAAVRAELFGIG